MPMYASGPEFSAVLNQFKDACELETHAVKTLLKAMEGGADFKNLEILTVAMEKAAATKMRLHQEMQRFAIGD